MDRRAFNVLACTMLIPVVSSSTACENCVARLPVPPDGSTLTSFELEDILKECLIDVVQNSRSSSVFEMLVVADEEDYERETLEFLIKHLDIVVNRPRIYWAIHVLMSKGIYPVDWIILYLVLNPMKLDGIIQFAHTVDMVLRKTRGELRILCDARVANALASNVITSDSDSCFKALSLHLYESNQLGDISYQDVSTINSLSARILGARRVDDTVLDFKA
jgi:hypothetical protein